MHVDTAVVLGHEPELVRFGLQHDRPFAGLLVLPLGRAHLAGGGTSTPVIIKRADGVRTEPLYSSV